jgi:hypothetical protein
MYIQRKFPDFAIVGDLRDNLRVLCQSTSHWSRFGYICIFGCIFSLLGLESSHRPASAGRALFENVKLWKLKSWHRALPGAAFAGHDG